MEHTAIGLRLAACRDCLGKCLPAVWLLQDADADSLMRRRGLSRADDVGGSFDFGLLHNAVAEVSEDGQPIAEQDGAAPILEGRDEETRARRDRAEIAVGFTELDTAADECGCYIRASRKPWVGGAQVWLCVWDRLAKMAGS